jgi:hypothetical protein
MTQIMTKSQLHAMASKWLQDNLDSDKDYDVEDAQETFSELQEFIEEAYEDEEDE